MTQTRVAFDAPDLPRFGGESLEDFIAELQAVLATVPAQHRGAVTKLVVAPLRPLHGDPRSGDAKPFVQWFVDGSNGAKKGATQGIRVEYARMPFEQATPLGWKQVF